MGGTTSVPRRRLALLPAAVLVALLGLPVAAQSPVATRITEYVLEYPGHTASGAEGHHGSTHELTFDPANPDHLWVTGQNDDALARVSLDGAISYHAVPTGSGPHGIVHDASGQLWATFEFGNAIARIAEDGTVAETIDVTIQCDGCPTPLGQHPHGLGVDPDGATLWFTGKSTNTIGRVDPDGSLTTWPIPTVGSVPIYIKAGPDGAMWFTELVGNAIGRITHDGEITEFRIPTPNSRPIEVAVGPDGAIWFSEEAGNKVGRITMDGVLTEYPIPKASEHVILAGLAWDDDGHLWVQQYVDESVPGATGIDHVVRIDRSIVDAAAGDLSGVPIEFLAVPTDATTMHRIILGPEGDMWFTELAPDRLGRIERP